MQGAFDPYRKWLGVRTSERPPNHYDLLGLEWFESDEETISHAADQRIAYVRTLALGDFADLSQQILNELAAAKVCLLNAGRKAEYDLRLQASLAGPTTPAPVSTSPAPASAPRTTVAPPPSSAGRRPPPPARIIAIASPDATADVPVAAAARNVRAMIAIGASIALALLAVAISLRVYARNLPEDKSHPLQMSRVEPNQPQVDGAVDDEGGGGTAPSANAQPDREEPNAKPKDEEPPEDDSSHTRAPDDADTSQGARGIGETMPVAPDDIESRKEPADAGKAEAENGDPPPSKADEPPAHAPALPALEPLVVNSLGMEMVLIPPGRFLMGAGVSKRPYEVKITRPFYLGKHEVTVAQYRRFVQETGHDPPTDANARVWDADGKKLTWNHNLKRKPDSIYSWRNPGFKQDDNE
ncbi:MAG TPA: SUMF1/EgtB/PvdO family nonheme iron enzyme [Pirellulales bacterium]|nr:SUMF1/EgtB/PvdO family nonheme iron enzyme [Pirellulales bacterium]